MSQSHNAEGRLDPLILRALNKAKRPSTAEEITDLLNRELGPGDLPIEAEEVERWLRTAGPKVRQLYWLATRPRR